MVRTDAESMSPGRVAAMTAHAGTLAGALYHEMFSDTDMEFPRTIILDGGDLTLDADLLEDTTGKIVDPRYLIKDGTVRHYIEFLTGYFWMVNSETTNAPLLVDRLRKYPLYGRLRPVSAW